MKKINILVTQRQTTIVGSLLNYTLSVFPRIMEPFDSLKKEEKISYRTMDEGKINFSNISEKVIVFSKHLSDLSVKHAVRAKNAGIKIIYDIDDFIIDFPKYSGCEINDERRNNFYQHMQLADAVTVSTPRLQEKLKEYIENETVLIQTGFDIERHYHSSKVAMTEAKEVKIVYTNGDRVKLNAFRDGFFRTMNTFLNGHPDLFFDMFCVSNAEVSNFSRCNFLGAVDWFEHKRLLLENNYYMGIVPLGAEEDRDDFAFNLCKSPIKYLEYGGLKIAGIYSKNPIYTDVIENGYNGLLVDNTEEAWLSALEELTNNKQLHKKIIENAHNDVKEKYHISKSAEQWMQVINKVMEC